MVEKRLWEIDSFRGAAIILMLVSNLITDLNYFGVSSINRIHPEFWWLFARLVAFIFVFLVGVSLTLSYSRARKSGAATIGKYIRRGAKIFLWGLAITAVTWLFAGEGFIIFGVLHLIGLGIILAYPLIRMKWGNLLLGLALIILGIYLGSMFFGFPWLLWLGFVPQGFYTLDYFPLMPWFGVLLLGVFAGNALYPGGKKRLADREDALARGLCFLGRNSLKIYIIHQPVLIGLLYIFAL